MYTICLIEGDGIGHEVIASAKQVISSVKFDVKFTFAEAGYECYLKHGTSIPQKTIDLAKDADATLFGAVTTPPNIDNYKSAIVTLRRNLDLYANVRPNKSFAIENSWPNIDITIVRENTEGLYIGDEEKYADYAITKRKISKKASERIVRYACDLAIRENRPKVTIVHKANVMRATDGLFLEVAQKVAREYPDIYFENLLVDTVAMRLIQQPQAFSVIVTTNMFGDILSDETCALVGGLGLAASGNIGDNYSLFEPVHGSAPDIAGKGIANPMATILAAAMMMNHLGEKEKANSITDAVNQTLKQGILPPDLGGKNNTKEITEAIISCLERGDVS